MSSEAIASQSDCEERRTTVLCELCKTIFASDEIAHKLVGGYTIEFCHPRLELEEREQEGCELCRFWLAMVRMMQPDENVTDRPKENQSASSMKSSHDEKPKADKEVLQFLVKKDDKEEGTIQVVVKAKIGLQQLGFLEMSTDQGILWLRLPIKIVTWSLLLQGTQQQFLYLIEVPSAPSILLKFSPRSNSGSRIVITIIGIATQISLDRINRM